MFKKIKEFFVGKPAAESKFAHPLDAVTTPSAPYKVPEPPATTPIPYVPAPAVVEAAPAPVVEAAPAKKPRKPRAPKVSPVVVKEKAPAKAKAPKLTVVKSTKSKKA